MLAVCRNELYLQALVLQANGDDGAHRRCRGSSQCCRLCFSFAAALASPPGSPCTPLQQRACLINKTYKNTCRQLRYGRVVVLDGRGDAGLCFGPWLASYRDLQSQSHQRCLGRSVQDGSEACMTRWRPFDGALSVFIGARAHCMIFAFDTNRLLTLSRPTTSLIQEQRPHLVRCVCCSLRSHAGCTSFHTRPPLLLKERLILMMSFICP